MKLVTDPPAETTPVSPATARPDDGASGGALEPRRNAELTPAEKAVRRRNRQWFLVVAIPAVVLGVAALIAAIVADQSVPSVRPLSVPFGYKAISDGVFAYAVPSSWSTNNLYSDDVGDLDTSGSSGWVAEHVDARASPPIEGEAAPKAFRDFGVDAPSPFHIGAAQPVRVPGTTIAFRYQITRPGGFRATAIDAWQSSSGAEIWLLVDAPQGTTAKILGTFTS
jgi:hypothetical protein